MTCFHQFESLIKHHVFVQNSDSDADSDIGKAAPKMHLMYTLDDSGNRLYTLKVSLFINRLFEWANFYT